MLEFGADIETRDEVGRTPLMIAEDNCVAKLLIEAGANLDARDNQNKTALMMAESTERAMMLIDAGADIDIVDKDGNTALFWALSTGLFTVADRLIQERPLIQEIEDISRRLALKVFVSHMPKK